MNSLAKKCINNEISALTNLYNVINTDEYSKIIQLLKNTIFRKGKIIINGVGKNAHIAAKASETFVSLGVPSFYLNTCHYFHGDAGFIQDKDTIIHISRSGKTEEMLFLIDHLYDNRPHIPQILIHCNDNKIQYIPTLEELCVGKVIEGDRYNLAPTASTSVLLCMLDIIGIVLSDHLGFTEADFLAFHPGGNLGVTIKQRLG